MSLEKPITFDKEIRNQRDSLPYISQESEDDRIFSENISILENNGLISVSDHVSSIMDK